MISVPDDKREVDALILERADLALSIGYEPDWSPEKRAAMLDEFRRVLRSFPIWAVKRAFSEWNRTRNRRPSPSEVRMLACEAIRPVTEELASRRKTTADAQVQLPRRTDEEREAASEILRLAGFTPRRFAAVAKNRMATHDDLKVGGKSEHFGPPKPPASWADRDQLARVRAADPMMQAARDDAARLAKRDDDEGAA